MYITAMYMLCTVNKHNYILYVLYKNKMDGYAICSNHLRDFLTLTFVYAICCFQLLLI